MTRQIGKRVAPYWRTWTTFVRGDIHELRAPRGRRGHEQADIRYAVVLQSDDLPLSTLLVAPTSRCAQPTSFRPTVVIGDVSTQVMAEQLVVVDPGRLGAFVGQVSANEMARIATALRLVLQLN